MVRKFIRNVSVFNSGRLQRSSAQDRNNSIHANLMPMSMHVFGFVCTISAAEPNRPGVVHEMQRTFNCVQPVRC